MYISVRKIAAIHLGNIMKGLKNDIVEDFLNLRRLTTVLMN